MARIPTAIALLLLSSSSACVEPSQRPAPPPKRGSIDGKPIKKYPEAPSIGPQQPSLPPEPQIVVGAPVMPPEQMPPVTPPVVGKPVMPPVVQPPLLGVPPPVVGVPPIVTPPVVMPPVVMPPVVTPPVVMPPVVGVPEMPPKTCPAFAADQFSNLPQATDIALPKALGFLEGAVWLEKEQALMFSAWGGADGSDGGPLSQIYKLKGTTWSTFSDRGVFSSNGLAVDSNGEVIAAMHGTQDVARVMMGGQKKVIANKYNGSPLNSPNDVTISKSGFVYFSDTSYSRGNRAGQPVTGVYGVKPDGTVFLIDGARRQPNGISLSLDGTILYVGSAENQIYKYKVAADGSVKADGILIDLGAETDGLTVDCQGNVYATVPLQRNVTIISPAGKILGKIATPANSTNVAFGGPNMTTLYITTAGKLLKAELKVPGAPF